MAKSDFNNSVFVVKVYEHTIVTKQKASAVKTSN